MELAERLGKVLKDAGITPRILHRASGIHYTTIYNYMRFGDQIQPKQDTLEKLNGVCGKIENLIKSGSLPFDADTLHKERTEMLARLLQQ